jgi:phosphatidylglycerophosphate synthase
LLKSASDKILNALIVLLHEKLGMTPNQISTLGFVIGTVAAVLLASGLILQGLIVLAFSQIVDGLDGGVARRYNLGSKQGEQLDMIYDRLNELCVFLALAYAGEITFLIAILAFVAILLVTILEPYSKFDPGFKRFMLYFGYLAGVIFQIHGFMLALNVVFFANLATFMVGTIMVDYRLQQEIDGQALLRREQEIALGILQPPDDPPSFLSKLFS